MYRAGQAGCPGSLTTGEAAGCAKNHVEAAHGGASEGPPLVALAQALRGRNPEQSLELAAGVPARERLGIEPLGRAIRLDDAGKRPNPERLVHGP